MTTQFNPYGVRLRSDLRAGEWLCTPYGVYKKDKDGKSTKTNYPAIGCFDTESSKGCNGHISTESDRPWSLSWIVPGANGEVQQFTSNGNGLESFKDAFYKKYNEIGGDDDVLKTKWAEIMPGVM